MAKGLWKNTYAGVEPGRILGRDRQSYFDCNRVNNWNHGPIGTREQLKLYDPDGYELVRDDVQPDARERLALHAAAAAAERDRAAGEVQDRPVLHEVHLGPRVPGARLEARQRRGAAQGQRHDPQDVRLPARHPEGDDRGRRAAGRAGPRGEAERPAGVQGREERGGARPRALPRLHADTEADGRSRGERARPAEGAVRGQGHGGERVREGLLPRHRAAAGRSGVREAAREAAVRAAREAPGRRVRQDG